MATELISLSELKEIAQLANVLLIPAVWILWKINLKLVQLHYWTLSHEKEDNMRFASQEQRLNEMHDRVGDLETTQ